MEFHYTVESNLSVEEAIHAVEARLKEKKFGVLWQMSITETLNSNGFDQITTPYHVLEVCSPQQAEKLLLQNPMANYFLPCRITVYEADGKTKIGMARPTVLMKPLNDETLMDIMATIEEQLIEAIEHAK